MTPDLLVQSHSDIVDSDTADSDIVRDLDDVLDELPMSLGSWSVRVESGVVRWIGNGPDDVAPFLTRVALGVAGVVGVRIEDSSDPRNG
jgi:hypothetical protein